MIPLLAPPSAVGAENVAARAINHLGLDLLRRTPPEANGSLVAPHSIQSTLAMTYVGASGGTREEMARTLHYPDTDAALFAGFRELDDALRATTEATERQAALGRERGSTGEGLVLEQAHRLYAQTGHPFRPRFLRTVAEHFRADAVPVDFETAADAATTQINDWVAASTRGRIPDLVPEGLLTGATRLVLVNAVYFRAPWADPFPRNRTRPRPFHLTPDHRVDVPTMEHRARLGLFRGPGFTAVTVPYIGGEIQLLAIVPEAADGLAAVEQALTPELLAEAGRAPAADVRLRLPRFHVKPPLMALGNHLAALGMPTAFDRPRGSADFDRMSPRRPNDYLSLTEVLHRTFIDLDENGTEAAAATAAVMVAPTSAIGRPPPPPTEVQVDRPFLFAIQHRRTGACLFLGRIRDPR